MRTRTSGGVRGGAGNRSSYSIHGRELGILSAATHARLSISDPPSAARLSGSGFHLTHHAGREISVNVSANVRTSTVRRIGVVVLCVKLALVPLVFDLSFDVPFTVP